MQESRRSLNRTVLAEGDAEVEAEGAGAALLVARSPPLTSSSWFVPLPGAERWHWRRVGEAPHRAPPSASLFG
jgi:hypothetical protein